MASNSSWSGGIHNRANFRKVPDGFVRDMVNLDPLVGGVLGLRSGYDQRYSAGSARGALSIKSKILFADGPSLVCFDTQSDDAHVIAQVAAAGRFSGTAHNQELFFCTATESLRFDGSTLRAWGVPTILDQPVPQIVSGGLRAGKYQAAVTLLNQQGEEGATTNPIQVTISDGQGLLFSPPQLTTGYRYRLYVSPFGAETLYEQYEGSASFAVTTLRDDTARLETMNLRSPPGGDHIASLGSSILIADGGTLWHTLAMSPHLVDMSKSFFQYPAPIDVMLKVDGGVFVCADKTYFLQSPDSTDVAQSVKLEFGAIPGTGSILPDGRATWMTQYGLAIGAFDGSVALLSQNNFVPEIAQHGASGLIDHNGNQMLVTTMSGQKGPNPLGASDFYEAEIVTL